MRTPVRVARQPRRKTAPRETKKETMVTVITGTMTDEQRKSM